MSIALVFTDISRCDDPGAYVDRKLGVTFSELSDDRRRALVQTVLAGGRPAGIEIVSPDLHPVLDERQTARLDRHRSLFARAVDRFSPLLPGERLLRPDVFSYLANGFREHQAGTPVLSRSTDQADLDYLFEGAVFDSVRGVVEYEGTTPRSSPQMVGVAAFAGLDGLGRPDPAVDVTMYIPDFLDPAVKRAGVSDQEILVGKIVKGLVGLIPEVGEGGAAVLGLFLPSGDEVDFKQLLDDVREISHDENARQTVATEAGHLHGVIRSMSTYVTLKAKRMAKQDLVSLWLTPAYQRVEESLGVLSEDYCAELALPTFLAGTNIKYLILQELAMQDESVPNETESAYCDVIRQAVAADVDHVTSTTQQLEARFDLELETRLGQVTDLHIRLTDCPKNEWYYSDLGAGYQSPTFQQSGCRDDPLARAGASRRAYVTKLEQEYRTGHHDQLPWMRLVANHWQRLQDHPLPAR